MKILIANDFNLAVESNDRDLLEAIKAQTDGWKVRGENRVLLPVKSGPKLFSFEKYGLEFVGGAEEVVRTVQYNVEKRKENIQKIKSQYGHEIKFEYDMKGVYLPMDHQKIMFNMMAYNSAAAILAEPGTCKTGPYLWAIDKRIQKGQVKKALVITLNSLKQNVLEEMKVQVPHLKGVILDGKAQADKVLNKGFKNAEKNKDYDIYLCNYEAIYSLSDLFTNDYFDMVVLDEAHRIGSYRSRQTKVIVDKFECTKYKYIVTGTISPNNSLSFFMPFRFLGPDCVPYANFYEFRRKYFFPVDPDGYIWKEGGGTRHEVKQIIGEMSVFFSKEECLDLPEIIYEQYNCEMENDQKKAYEDLKKNFVTTILDMCKKCDKKGKCDKLCDQQISVKNALTVITKLQQIACGILINTTTKIADDGKEEEVRNIIKFDSNPKLRLLIETLNNIPADRKVIIWSQFINVTELIAEAIEKSGLGKSVLIYKDVNAFEAIEQFKDPKYRYAIANASKAGSGLNAQFSNYQVFYSNGYSLIQREQAIARQHRAGQKSCVTVIDLCCNNTIDIEILRILNKKEELAGELVSLANIRKLLSI